MLIFLNEILVEVCVSPDVTNLDHTMLLLTFSVEGLGYAYLLMKFW